MAQLLVAAGADGSRAAGTKEEQVAVLFAGEVGAGERGASLAGSDTPGAAVLVSHGDSVLLEAAYGMANLEHDIPVAVDTRFQIGSITKQFTAVAILLLEQDGLLAIDDPLSRFLPTYARGEQITLRHRLTHIRDSRLHARAGVLPEDHVGADARGNAVVFSGRAVGVRAGVAASLLQLWVLSAGHGD